MARRTDLLGKIVAFDRSDEARVTDVDELGWTEIVFPGQEGRGPQYMPRENACTSWHFKDDPSTLYRNGLHQPGGWAGSNP